MVDEWGAVKEDGTLGWRGVCSVLFNTGEGYTLEGMVNWKKVGSETPSIDPGTEDGGIACGC